MHCAVYANSPEFIRHVFASEDGIVEWLSFLCFLAAGLLALGTLRYRARMSRLAFVYLLGLGLAFIACSGEEISWGQRLFGFQTPRGLMPLNEQGEFNLHNLCMSYLHPVAVLSLFMKLFGIVGPLVVFLFRKRIEPAGWRYVAPLYLVPCFIVSQLFKTLKRSLIAWLAASWGHEGAFANMPTSEISEMYWGLCLLLAMVAIARAWRKECGSVERALGTWLR